MVLKTYSSFSEVESVFALLLESGDVAEEPGKVGGELSGDSL